MTTLLQTSESKLAVRSRTSLCLREGSLPFGQDKACSMVKERPQAQEVGRADGSQ